MSKADLLVERSADSLQHLADRAAARNDGVGQWLAEELRNDAAFLRKLKPSLIKARAKGDAPTNQEPTAGARRARSSARGPSRRRKSARAGKAPRRCSSSARRSSPGSCWPRSSTGEAMHTPETEHDEPRPRRARQERLRARKRARPARARARRAGAQAQGRLARDRDRPRCGAAVLCCSGSASGWRRSPPGSPPRLASGSRC